MAKYLLENIRTAFPTARLGLAVGSRGAMIKDLLLAYPWIEVHEASRRDLPAAGKLISRFWRSDFVLTPYTAGTVTLPTKIGARILARRGRLAGFADKSPYSRFFYDVMLKHGGRGMAPRLLEQMALKAAGVPITQERMSYRYVPQEGLLPRLGLTRGEYVVLHLFAGSQTRGLNPAQQQALVNELSKEFSVPLVFTGTARDHEHIRRLNLPPGAVMAETTVQEMAALLDNAKGMVSVGTGPSHMSSLLGKPTVVMCACNGVAWCGREQYGDAPVRVFARPDLCPDGHGGDEEGYSRCMNGIDMAEVARAAKKLFESS
jgi:ADP-heptose:LPS heptosyltransferase